MNQTYLETNAKLSQPHTAEEITALDAKAAREYFLENINQNTVFFHTLEEKINHLTSIGAWDKETLEKYDYPVVKELFQQAYAYKFRFPNFIGAYKFYTSYALRTPDGSRIYERFEDRVVLNALAYSKDEYHAKDIVNAIMTGRFQPATPTFLNAGRGQGGEPVSCFLLDADDNMEAIAAVFKDSLQLSRRGGGVSINLTDLRENGAPIKNHAGAARGVIPVMKILEDIFSYADQLGQRQGAGAAYLHIMHPDIMAFLDTKRENADEKIRIKTLSLGVVIPDVFMRKAKTGEHVMLPSVYDLQQAGYGRLSGIDWEKQYDEVEKNPLVSKTYIDPRQVLARIAQIQMESGYPFIVYQDAMNRGNPAPWLGPIRFSNLCTEIAQSSKPGLFEVDGSDAGMEEGYATACNLGSFNIHKMLELLEAGELKQFERTVTTAVEFLDTVVDAANLECSPTVNRGNSFKRAIGLGQMNLHGALLYRGMPYDSDQARELFDKYLAHITFYAIKASMWIMKTWITSCEFPPLSMSDPTLDRTGFFETMKPHLKKYFSEEDIGGLHADLKEYGINNTYLQAIPPTGSISYINNSTPSIHPIVDPVEIRKEGKIGRIHSPAFGLAQWMEKTGNQPVETAYSLGWKPIIDMYAVALPYVDQASSLTLFFKEGITTRDINKAQIYAWKKGIKSLYYTRIRQTEITSRKQAVEASEECVACAL